MTLARRLGYLRLDAGPIQRQFRLHSLLMLVGLLLAVAALALAAAPLGSHETGFVDLVNVLIRPSLATGDGAMIIREFRLPRIVMAVLAGAMLGMAGAAMQALTRNGLADPGLLGVKEGTSLAVVTLILFFPSTALWLRPVVGMAGGLLTALIVVAIARDPSRMRFILIGIGMSWIMAAALSIILTTSDVRDMQIAMVWMAGSLNAVSWNIVPVAIAFAVAGGLLLLATAGSADVALLGDQAATGLGVRLSRLSLIRFAAPVLMTAACVACVGSLGFVGLIGPHLARLALRGGSQAASLCGSALCGAILVLVADTIGRIAFAPLQLPAGIAMAVVGVPVLLALLWHRRDLL